MKVLLHISILTITLLISCKNETSIKEEGCPEKVIRLAEFTTEDGLSIRIYDDGNAYSYSAQGCEFLARYFEPGFFDRAYTRTQDGVFLKSDEDLFPVFRNFEENFENQEDDLDFIIQSIDQTDRAFNAFTLQSPSAKTVSDYVALRKCILDGTCDFIDNRFDLATDPVDPTNTVLQLYAVAPSEDMVTCKTSIKTGLVFFEQGDEFWFEADFYIDGPYPTTIADFESSFFLESPGPRLIFRNGYLAVENKFNEKLNYDQTISQPIIFPLGQWVHVKVSITYDTMNGRYRVWQNDQLIIDTPAKSMPFDIWIQDEIEVGISATNQETTLLVDNIHFSDRPFED